MTLADKIENRMRSERNKHKKNYWIKVCAIKLAHDFEFLLAQKDKEFIEVLRGLKKENSKMLVDEEGHIIGCKHNELIEKALSKYKEVK